MLSTPRVAVGSRYRTRLALIMVKISIFQTSRTAEFVDQAHGLSACVLQMVMFRDKVEERSTRATLVDTPSSRRKLPVPVVLSVGPRFDGKW